jgi:hypothetical protein
VDGGARTAAIANFQSFISVVFFPTFLRSVFLQVFSGTRALSRPAVAAGTILFPISGKTGPGCIKFSGFFSVTFQSP